MLSVPRYWEAAGADHVVIAYGLVPDAINVMRNMYYGQGSEICCWSLPGTVLYLPVWGAAGCPASVQYRLEGGENGMTYVFVAAPSQFLKGGSNYVPTCKTAGSYSVTELVGFALTTT